MNTNGYPEENYVEIPYLPKNDTKLVIADCRISKSIETKLNRFGIEIIKLLPHTGYCEPINCHPDVRICHLDYDLWIIDGKIVNSYQMACLLNSNNVLNQKTFFSYPDDVSHNCVNLPDFLICNKNHTNTEILNFAINKGKTIIDVKQGYAKCSVLIVDNNAIITEDTSIYNSAVKHNIDCLLLKQRECLLDGYNCGFIGGSGFKYNKKTLMFCGCVENHSQFEDIKSFCKNYSIDCVSLSGERLYDYGTVITVCEK